MSCKCGGNCVCFSPAKTSRMIGMSLGMKAADSDLVVACRNAQLEDTVGACVVLTQDEYDALVRATK